MTFAGDVWICVFDLRNARRHRGALHCGRLDYSGNSKLIAAIYAPNADLTLNGGGNNNGLIGSSITKSIKMNGHYTFHFDEHLSTLNYILGYTISTWKEL
jgi:hypothetical protein